MTIDLQLTLTDLALSVHDDALSQRLTAQVGPMVGRIRRRRAARAAAVGAASMGTVAAATVGAVALANGGGSTPPPPATQAPPPATPVVHDGTPLECGDAVPTALLSDEALAITGEVPAVAAYGSDLPTLVRWWAPGTETVTYTNARIDMALASDGVVVGVAGQDSPSDVSTQEITLGSTETGTNGAYGDQLPVDACGGDTPLGAGEYQVVATVTLTSGDGEVRQASAGPWPLTIAPASADPANDEAEAAVQEIVDASPQVSAANPIGTCGTLVPEPGDEPLAIELDLDDGSGMLYTPGDLIDAVTIVTSAEPGTSVLANVPASGATVVLARDGVVVGRGAELDDEAMLVETSDAEPQVFYGNGEVLLCSLPGADAPELPLPAGIYQAYAILPVALKEVTEADGTARSVSDTVVIRSRPVDVIVSDPKD